jgi:hypothetical protein
MNVLGPYSNAADLKKGGTRIHHVSAVFILYPATVR